MSPPMDAPNLDQLGRLLLAEGLITQEDMDEALKRVEDAPTRHALEQISYVRTDELGAFLAMDYRMPELGVIPDSLIDVEVMKMLPESYIRRAKVMPLKKIGRVTLVAAVDLPDDVTLTDLRGRVRSKIKVVKVPEAEMERHLHKLWPMPKMAATAPAAAAHGRKPSSTAMLPAVKVEEAPTGPVPKPAPEALTAVRLSEEEFARLARQYGEPVVRQWERRFTSSEPIPATRVQ